MKALFVVVKLFLLCYIIRAEENNSSEDFDLSCAELKHAFVWSWIYSLSKPQKFKEVGLYLAVKDDINGIKISEDNMSAIESEHFDSSLKTYVIIHGYRSNHKKDWIVKLKDKLLENRKINIITVDWSSGSKSLNYINTVRNTYTVANYIFRIFEAIQAKLKAKDNVTNILWNNLYFIGHSLGAHISAQAARLFQNNTFFNVERITGLDPAQPCFQHAKLNLKLDRNDAKFVDVIHTQTGSGKGGFGVKEAIGHADFYVNGGVLQPSCKGSIFTTKLEKMVCSHMKACAYFIDSIDNSNSNSSLKFDGYSWDGTYDTALKIVDEVKNETACLECPKMGIDAVNYEKKGIFLVITLEESQGKQKEKEINDILEVLKKLKKK